MLSGVREKCIKKEWAKQLVIYVAGFVQTVSAKEKRNWFSVGIVSKIRV